MWEDYGQPAGHGVDQASSDTWCLGSQYWTRNLHVPGYTARYGILLDMVGARDARFYQEAISMRYAPRGAQGVADGRSPGARRPVHPGSEAVRGYR